MNILVTITIKKPIQEVWEVVGSQFGEVHLWSSNFKTSKPGGKAKFKGIDYSLRDTTTERGNTIQELTAFDVTNYLLTYRITKGAPEIAKEAGATWSLKPKDVNTDVVLDFMMESKIPLNPEMETKIKMGLTASVNQLAEELKYYLETGEAHPNNTNKN